MASLPHIGPAFRATVVSDTQSISTLPLIDPASWSTVPIPERSWSWNGWMPARQATYLTGAGSSGKSLLSQLLSTCIALGLPCLGVETVQSVAMYVTCEDDEDELHRRQKAICEALNVPIDALSGKLHLVSLAGAIGNELATFDPNGCMKTTEAWTTLRATVLATGTRFIALDNVAHLYAGNENIRNQVAAFCGLLNSLAANADASVLFIGHPNKAGDSFSGSTAWENQVRSRIFLDKPKDSDGNVTDPDGRTLSRAKANYARTGDMISFRWHKWTFVRSEDLAPDITAEIAANVQAASENEMFLKMLALTTSQRRAVSHLKGTNWACSTFAKMTEGKRMNATAYDRALERLLSLGKIKLGQWLWLQPNRHPAFGIKLTADCADPPASTPRANPRHPPCADPRAPTPLYPTGISSAASEADALDTSYEPVPNSNDWTESNGVQDDD